MITSMCYSKFCNLWLTFTNICALFVCVCYPCGARIYGSWYVGGSAAGVGAPALSAPPPSCLSSLKPLNWAHCGNAAPGGSRTESGTLTHRQSAFEVVIFQLSVEIQACVCEYLLSESRRRSTGNKLRCVSHSRLTGRLGVEHLKTGAE